MKKRNLWRFIAYPIIAVTIAGITAGNVVAYIYRSAINSELVPPLGDSSLLEKNRASGKALANQIEEEGATLLKNDNNVLPLSKKVDKKVNIFGHGAIHHYYTGLGSGGLTDETDKNGKPIPKVSLLDAFDHANIEYNKTLINQYNLYSKAQDDLTFDKTSDRGKYALTEPSISQDKNIYSDGVLDYSKKFSDVAIAVISRTGSECNDVPMTQMKNGGKSDDPSRHYLQISTEEEELLRYLGENYEKVIVLLNTSGPFETGFMDTIPGLDACLFISTPGHYAFDAIPKLLYGEVTPSGHLTDTLPYSFKDEVNYYYTGLDGYNRYNDSKYSYVDYIENIYVGYRYFETADSLNKFSGKQIEVYDASKNKIVKNGYDAVVQYPFGYGLSYTNFEWTLKEFTMSSEKIQKDTTFKAVVNVKNVGKVKGQDVVGLYVSLPYVENGIEKSSIQLLDFNKTSVALDPDTDMDLTLTFDAYDFASYDAYDKNSNDFKGYEIEQGDYKFSFRKDVHNIKEIKDSNGNIIPDSTITKSSDGFVYETDPDSNVAVNNKFTGTDAIDYGISVDGATTEQNVNYLSRTSLPSQAVEKASNRQKRDDIINVVEYGSHKELQDAWDNKETDIFGNQVDKTNPTWGKTDGEALKVGNDDGTPTDLGLELGANYDDPRWEQVLDQVSLSEANSYSSNGARANPAIPSIGKPSLADFDGPSQILCFGSAPNGKGTGTPQSFVLAMTWNKDLAYSFGLNYAKEMDALGIAGAYGPSINLHRNLFNGRNFEYLSEDPLLTGKMASNVTRAIVNSGKYVYMKHFAGNEQEQGRYTCITWMTEQALRELYLKPFEIAIKDGKANGIMTCYSQIGATWTGGSEALLTGVLKGEWGFRGAVVTDWVQANDVTKSMEQMLRAGGDLAMGSSYCGNGVTSSSPARYQRALRRAVKDGTYAWLNGKAENKKYNEALDDSEKIQLNTKTRYHWNWWVPTLIAVDIVVGSAALALITFIELWDFKDKKGESKNGKEKNN